jgi:hypothetical protein
MDPDHVLERRYKSLLGVSGITLKIETKTPVLEHSEPTVFVG